MTSDPDLQFFDGPEALDLGPVAELRLMWRNEAGAGAGLAVLVWGDAVSEGLVEIGSAQLRSGPRVQPLTLVREDSADGALYRAQLPAWPIASARGIAADGPVSTADLERLGATMVEVVLELRARSAGQRTLLVALCTLGAEWVEPVEVLLRAAPQAT